MRRETVAVAVIAVVTLLGVWLIFAREGTNWSPVESAALRSCAPHDIAVAMATNRAGLVGIGRETTFIRHARKVCGGDATVEGFVTSGTAP